MTDHVHLTYRDIQKLERRLKAITQKVMPRFLSEHVFCLDVFLSHFYSLHSFQNEMLQKTAEMYEQDKKELLYEV